MGNGHEIGIWIGTVQYLEAWTERHAQILMQEADYLYTCSNTQLDSVYHF